MVRRVHVARLQLTAVSTDRSCCCWLLLLVSTQLHHHLLDETDFTALDPSVRPSLHMYVSLSLSLSTCLCVVATSRRVLSAVAYYYRVVSSYYVCRAYAFVLTYFSDLTLLVGRQEGHVCLSLYSSLRSRSRGVARGVRAAPGGTFYIGATNGRKLFFLNSRENSDCNFIYIMCLREIKTKHYSCSAYLSFLSITGYSIGSLAASGSTLLVLPDIFAFRNKSIVPTYCCANC